MSSSVSSLPAAHRGDLGGLLDGQIDVPRVISVEAPVASAWRVLPEKVRNVVMVAPTEGPLRLGWGIAESFIGTGPGRLQQLQTWSQTTLLGIQTSSGPSPVIFTGFAFEDEVDEAWKHFGPAQGVLPRYVYVQQDGQAWLQAYVGPNADRSAIAEDLQAALRRLQGVSEVPALGVSVRDAGSLDLWVQGVERVQAAMRDEGVDKVVLSRQIELGSERAVYARTLVAHLLKSEAQGTRFVFAFAGQAFLGVTPERLVRVQGRQVHSAALAGSRPRGQSSDLLSDAKELQEHGYVARHVQDRLSPLCVEFVAPQPPELLALGYVTHLHTPMQGQLRKAVPALELVELLHPTPAVGGVPIGPAQALIRQIEGCPRGWYTGGIGCVDATGAGEIWVALRCALLGEVSGRAFVGAGIVSASNPIKEWAETEAKGQAVLSALGVRP